MIDSSSLRYSWFLVVLPTQDKNRVKAQDKTISFFASQIEFLESELADLATLEFDWHLLLLNQTHLMWMDSLLSVRRNSLWWNFCSHSITYFNIVCYMVQAPLWRHAYRSPFQRCSNHFELLKRHLAVGWSQQKSVGNGLERKSSDLRFFPV